MTVPFCLVYYVRTAVKENKCDELPMGGMVQCVCVRVRVRVRVDGVSTVV